MADGNLTARRSLAGKTALVTGASRGIGRAIAVQLARAGATVVVHYGENAAAADGTLRLIEAAGGTATAIAADLGRSDDIAALFESFDAGGPAGLDILVNNAGIGAMAAIGDTDEALFDRLFDVNAKGLFFTTRAALPRMNDGGRIIAISSMVSLAAYPVCLAYAMTKAAVNAFIRSLAAELGARGITVNAVAPGATDTDFIAGLKNDLAFIDALAGAAALKRLGTPDDIADAVLFLASAEGGWITGQVLEASGGMHL